MISLLTPTRKRPDRLCMMINSAIGTVAGEIEILCYVADEDDSYDRLIEYEASMRSRSGDFGGKAKIRYIRGPRFPAGGTFSDLWNTLIPHARGDIFMQCADDVFFKTPRWDLVVEKAYADCPDKILLVYADDMGPNGKRFASLPFVSRRWVEIVGYFTGPGFAADFSDAWPFDVAVQISRDKFLPGIEIEHVHHVWNKAALDETYLENRARYSKEKPDVLYYSAEKRAERDRDAQKLRHAIAEFRVKQIALDSAVMGEK